MRFGRHIALSGKLAKRVFVTLAILALSVVVLRPICDVSEALAGTSQPVQRLAVAHSPVDHSHHDDSGPCCESVDDASLIGAATAFGAATTAGGPFMVLPATSAATWPAVADSQFAAIPPDRPPLSLPYHARSARLLI